MQAARRTTLISPPTPEPEPELELTVEQTDYTLGAVEERTATAVFTAKNDWTLSVVYDNAGTGTGTETDDETATEAAWLTVTPASGAAGKQTVELAATPKITEESRTAYVDIACGKQSVRLTVTQTGASDETNFSALFDPEFAKVLQDKKYISDAKKITRQDMTNIAAITELNISGDAWLFGSLTSLQGIEYFKSLAVLNCYFNRLTTLDVCNCTALTTLACNYNKLTSLDVSGCTELTKLYCNRNLLTSLDVSKNTKLTWLNCDYNQLPTLDVSNNTELTRLWCNENQLTELNVSNNTALTWLDCSSNQLTELDVSKNTALIYLDCNGNPGDGESVFPVKVWADFNLNSIPSDFTKGSWEYGGKTITIDYRTATAE